MTVAAEESSLGPYIGCLDTPRIALQVTALGHLLGHVHRIVAYFHRSLKESAKNLLGINLNANNPSCNKPKKLVMK